MLVLFDPDALQSLRKCVLLVLEGEPGAMAGVPRNCSTAEGEAPREGARHAKADFCLYEVFR